MLRAKLQEIFASALSGVAASRSFGLVDFVKGQIEILSATNYDRGDFACAVALKLKGKLDISVTALAQAIAKALDSEFIENVQVAENGFINLTVSKQALATSVGMILADGEIAAGGSKKSVNYEPEWHYASHRLSAALRQLVEPRPNLLEGCLSPALLPESDLEFVYIQDIKVLEAAFEPGLLGVELASDNRKLALFLDEFSSVADSYRLTKNEPLVRQYTQDLVIKVNQSYVLDGLLLTQATELKARAGLIVAAKRVFGACLGILNLAVPERL